jgi:hypothetical protein
MKSIVIPNRISTGFLVGLIFPLLVFLVVFLVSSGERDFSTFLNQIQFKNVISHFISLCVFPNVFAFLIFNRMNKYQSSQGVLGMTIIWALLVFIIKMI